MDAELIAHDPVTPPEEQPPADPPPAQDPPPAANLDADAAPEADIDAEIDAKVGDQGIKIPDGEELIPKSLLKNVAIDYRNKLKAAKSGGTRAKELEQQLQQYQQQWQQAAPYIQAAQAMLAARQMAPQQQGQPQPEPQDDTEAVELAKTLDLYKPDGTPDVDKAKKTLALMDKRAKSFAQEQVAPVIQHTAQQQAAVMLARAKATKAPNGTAADPAILDQVWASADPRQVANPEYAKWLWTVAYGLTHMNTTPQAQKQAEAPPPPLYTERSGGQDAVSYRLNEGDKRLARELNMTDAQFAKQVADMPWGKK